MEATAPAPGGVWAPERRRLTAGLVLTITLVAFEALAISTVLPVVSDDLGGLSLYGWVFSGFFLGSLLGIVAAGQLADSHGTALPFAAGLVLFTAGLVAGGLAPSMGFLVAARVAQGIGAGAIPAVAYASVGRAYPPALRPRVFAVFSSAWVIPGLVGPAASSGIAGGLGWRAVFLALLPFVAIAAAITLPALTRFADGPVSEGTGGLPGAAPEEAPGRRRVAAVALTIGVAAVLAALNGPPVAVAVGLAVVGTPLAVRAFLHIVPAGTLRLAPGIPAAIAIKGILTFAFFGADAYVSLAFQEVRGQPTWVAGAALTGTTVAWTAAAWVQERVIHRTGPRWLVRRGFLLVAVGTLGMLAVLGPLPIPVAVAVWSVAGFGIGLAYSPISVTVLDLAAAGKEGAASASVQLCDVLGTALGTGAAGALVALGEARSWAPRDALELAFALTAVVAVLGAVAARRLPAVLPD